MEELIKNKCAEISEVFRNVVEHNYVEKLHYNIDISKLNPDYATRINITEEGDFVKMFKELQDEKYANLPAIYVFGINSDINSTVIVNAIDSLKDLNQDLNTPAHYKYPQNKGILYVGKVKSCAWGRLIQHLGYHEDSKSHGLQIQYWAQKISEPLELTYTVMFFEEKMADYIELLERAIAKTEIYKPLIGKH